MSARQAKIALPLHAKQGVALQTTATEVLYGGAAGAAKALALDTPIATPYGWTTMGEIRVGDAVFDECGKPCNVVAMTPVMVGNTCYRMTFSDGAQIVADAGHQWVTLTGSERARLLRRTEGYRAARRAIRPSRAKEVSQKPWVSISAQKSNRERVHEYLDAPTGTVRTTAEICATIGYDRRGGYNHSIAVAKALECPDVGLPIDPYVLGLWLGDGATNSGRFTTADVEMVEAIAANGYHTTKGNAKYAYGIHGLATQLRALGVLGNKHIPAAYLRASESQRLALAQGLFDTDGTCDTRGQCGFTTTKRALADGMAELLTSLGIKAAIKEGVAKLNGRTVGPKYGFHVLSEKPLFRLGRKLIRQKRGGFRGTHDRRYIEACEEIPSVPVRCIQVDSPSHLFLAGREMIPTHNSHLMRVAAIMWCGMVPGLQVYLFRRLRDDLVKNHVEGSGGFRALLAPWILSGHCNMVEDEIRFWNRSKIYLCHCKDEKDRFKYLGSEIHVLLIDELTTFTEVIYRFLRSRVRMAGIEVPKALEGLFPRILCGSNPGNVGHHWVKQDFIDARPPYEIERVPTSEGGMLRQFIPGRLSDNPSIDPEEYRGKLEGLGSPALVKAMLEGDWNVVAGAFFECWSTEKHVIKPFTIPANWTKGASFDWGSARPFSVGWHAISDGNFVDDDRTILYPTGAIIRFAEWYGGSGPNKGLGLTPRQVAKGIKDREKEMGHRIEYRVADPACWKVDGGPSHAEVMIGEGVAFRAADNSRETGAIQVRSRLIGEDGVPMLYVFDTCAHTIRTIPALQHDPHKPEDIDSDSDDHVYDELRYFCMSRPWTRLPKVQHPMRGTAQMTMNEVWKLGAPKAAGGRI